MRNLLTQGLPLALMAALLIAGCVSLPSEKIEITRYTIEPKLDSIPNGDNFPVSVYVMPLTAASDQKSDRINYRLEANEMNRFYYHRWSAAPQKLIGDALSDFLVETKLFEDGVYQEAVGVTPEYELHGKLMALFSNDERRAPSTVFEIRITMFRIQLEPYVKYKVFQKQYRYEQTRRNSRVPSFIETSDKVIGEWLIELHNDLAKVLADPPLPPPEQPALQSAVQPPPPPKPAEGPLEEIIEPLAPHPQTSPTTAADTSVSPSESPAATIPADSVAAPADTSVTPPDSLLQE